MDASTSVILDASNANAEPAVIDFGRGELSREGGGRSSLRSVRDVTGQSVMLRLPVEVGKGKTAEFVFGFRYEARRPRR